MALAALAALALLACKLPQNDGGDASPNGDPTAAWVGKWHGGGSYTITSTGQKPIAGPATMDLNVTRGDAGAGALHLTSSDGQAFDLFVDPAHPDTAGISGAIQRGGGSVSAVGQYEASAKLAQGKMHLVSTSHAHGTFHFDNLHNQADAQTVVTVDLDRVK